MGSETFGLKKRSGVIAVALLACALSIPSAFADPNSPDQSLESGFRDLYGLQFSSAHQIFSAWTQQHPDDPLGPVCDAAGLLFSEFNRLGVLESQFYENDHAFDGRKQLSPDPDVRVRFNAALDTAELRAGTRLAKNSQDRDALFAMTLSFGLQADYAAMIEKSNLASLHDTKQATIWAQQLLAVDPNCSDARVATGFSKYIVGSMAAPVRWILRLGGVAGDKNGGIADLQITARNGHYLAPFARILLAIAYVRDKDNLHAREVLASLRDEFPGNPLFSREIARLDSNR